jgi:hypothetical protein
VQIPVRANIPKGVRFAAAARCGFKDSFDRLDSLSDVWDDEGFGGEDDWAGDEGMEGDLEDDSLAGLDAELDEAELPDGEGDDEMLSDED